MTTLTRSALDNATDELLADRAADGDPKAFAVLVRRYRRLLQAYAARMLGSNADSDDVAQDALVTAWQQLPTLRDRARVRSWLLQITSRKALDVIRRRRPQDDIDDSALVDQAAGPAQRAGLQSLQQALDENLAALPSQQRQVWVLRELGGHSYDEIAAELQLPTSTVRGLLARARSQLIRDMDDWR